MSSTRVGQIIEDVVFYVFMLIAIPLKHLTWVHSFLPKKLQGFMLSWDTPMILAYVTSFGRKVYIDQRAKFPTPTSYQPLAETEPRFRLSEEDIRGFYENGFIGPLTLCSPEEMVKLREEINHQINTVSEVYDHVCGRDRHLDCKAVQDLITRPKITETLAQLLGPDLLMWRSQVVMKEPGAPEVTWHQATTYLMEEIHKATLFPPNLDELFQLTTWVAFDDADIENGCLQFVPNTHRKINKIIVGGDDSGGFVDARVKLDVEIDPKQVFSAEMKAGQFVIFSERVIHGSPPNISDRRRWGMTFRTVKPNVKVYDDEPQHNVAYLNKGYNLEKWGGLMLRGKNAEGVNPLYQKPASDKRADKAETVENAVLWT